MNSHRKIYGLMVMTTVFWAGAFIAAKMSVPYIPTFTLTFLRFLIASLILAPVMVRKGKTEVEPFRMTKDKLPVVLFTGLVGIFGYHILFFEAAKYTSAINSSIIVAMNPIVTLLIGFLFARQRFSGRMLLGVVLSFVGVTLTITGASFAVLKDFSFNTGDIMMFAAVVCWAAYSAFSKYKSKGIPPLALTYYSFLVATILLIPFALFERPWEWITNVPVSAWMAVFYMSIFASVIGYLVQQVAISEIGPERTSIFINLVPAFSIVLAVLILHEPLAPVKLLTAALIICGVVLCQTQKPHSGGHEPLSTSR